jgi:hypothetical protein
VTVNTQEVDTPVLAAFAMMSSVTGAASLSIADTANHVINAAESTAVAFTVSELNPGTIGTVTFADAADHHVVVNIAANRSSSADLSTLTDGPIGSSLSAADPAGNVATATGNAGSLDTDSALTPSLSVNVANPADVKFTMSGLESDYSGTFTGSSGQQDVVLIGANGNYFASLSNLTNGTLTYLKTVSDPAGNVTSVDPTATLGPSSYPDGAAGAQAGAAQHPNLLSGYAVRPAWQVAGVDYAVGVPSSMALKDPAAINMAGISVDTSSRSINITGSNITLNGYDFSLHSGYQVSVSGDNATIENSNFALGSNTGAYLINGEGNNLTIKYCTFDASTIGNETSILGFRGAGTITLQYNWFRNFPQHVLEMTQPLGVSDAIVYQYNLIEQGAIEPEAHLNFLQLGDGNISSANVSFNTTYQTPQVSGGEGFQAEPSPGTITNYNVTNNTMIATGGPTGSAMSYMLHVGSGSFPGISTGTVINNYFDVTAAYGAFYPGQTGFAYSNNVDMTTGRIITGRQF